MTEKHSFYLDAENYKTALAMYKTKNFSTISELMNTALKEWIVRNVSQKSMTFVAQELCAQVENSIQVFERRVSHMLFKLAVSDTELKHIIAAYYSADEDYLREIHDRSIREVRVTNGLLNVSKMIQEKEDTSWPD